MDANELLTRLSEYPMARLHVLRSSPVLEQFPKDSAAYLTIADEFFAGSNPDWERRNLLVQILREFLYRDGRSFEALLCVAERAFCAPEYSFDGISALAGISWYVRDAGHGPPADDELVAKFGKWMQNDELRHNAKLCRDLILRRRPDLAGPTP